MDVRSARAAYYSNKKVVSRGRLSVIEMRDSGDGKVTFLGYASTTGDAYTVTDWLGEYEETMAVGAFGKSLKEQDDVRALVNHDGVPFARTKSGTLDLTEITDPAKDPQGRGQTGLWCEAPDLDMANPTVQEMASAMKRGDLSEMSFSFMATRQEWNEDYTERTVLECRLFDVSVVTYPANPYTSADLTDGRSIGTQQIMSLIDGGRALSEDQRSAVRAAFEERDALLAAAEPLEEPTGDPVVDDRALALAAARLESARVDSL